LGLRPNKQIKDESQSSIVNPSISILGLGENKKKPENNMFGWTSALSTFHFQSHQFILWLLLLIGLVWFQFQVPWANWESNFFLVKFVRGSFILSKTKQTLSMENSSFLLNQNNGWPIGNFK
jgi:hypothetical protein